MQRHTLEAVFSMPDELFFNSNVGVVTCVMVFTAHHRHPASKEVFLGYCKDDGFTKTKLTGRADNNGNWRDISRKWLDHYMNKREKPGLSVKKTLVWNDEWCAEAYMETDYAALESAAPFVRAIHEYTSYLFSNRMVEQVSAAPFAGGGASGKPAMPGTAAWVYFPLRELFDIAGTATTLLRDLQAVENPADGYPYVTTQATNNGVKTFVDSSTEDAGVAGVLTVDSAVLGYCAYQAHPFSASDHVEKLAPKFPMNKYTAMFLTTVINQEQYRYNYGRKCSQTRLKSTAIKLPSADGENPDWALMEKYIQSLPYSSSL